MNMSTLEVILIVALLVMTGVAAWLFWQLSGIATDFARALGSLAKGRKDHDQDH